MMARFITRCGCERMMRVPSPPPRFYDIPLKPPAPNLGHVRSWTAEDYALRYDPRRDGPWRRRFRLSLESLDSYERGNGDGIVWYDELCDFDPSGYDVDKRTYAKAGDAVEAPDSEGRS